MGKIIEFKTEKEQRIDDFLEKVKQNIKEYDLDNIYLASKAPNGEIHIGSCNLDLATRVELASHLQIDIMNKFIKENYLGG